jgi:hypothetical protein
LLKIPSYLLIRLFYAIIEKEVTMAEYFVRVVKRVSLRNEERVTVDLRPFEVIDNKDPNRELGMAKELGWADACGVSPLPDSGVLFRKKGSEWEEVACVF